MLPTKLTSTGLRRMLASASLAVILLTMLSLFMIKLHLDSQTQTSIQLSENIVRQVQAEKLRQLATQTNDYAYWNESVEAVLNQDRGWADTNFGSYLLETFGLDVSLVSGPGDSIFFYAASSDETPTAQDIIGNDGIRQLVETAREQATDQPAPTNGIITIGGKLMMVSVALILPDNDDYPKYQRDHTLLTGRLIDTQYLADIEQLLFLEHMSQSAQPMDGFGNLVLTAPDGSILSYLHWQPRQSGSGLGTLAMIFSGSTLAIVLISIGLLWQLYRLAKHYQHSAIVDDLTGLYNRRYFNTIADQEMRRLCRDEYLIGFLLLDVDNFKKFNDRYGHQAGDGALQRISKEMGLAFERASDHVCRLGGEEFGVIFIGKSEDQITTQAEQLRARIQALDIPHAGNPPHNVITVSIGGLIARARQGQCDIDKAYHLADQALYAAKAQGRNRVYLETVSP